MNTDLGDGSLLFDPETSPSMPPEIILLNATHVTTLSCGAQKAIVLIFTGLEKRNSELILAGFQAMGSLTRLQEQELTSIILKELALPASASSHFEALLVAAGKLAVEVEQGVLAFDRGRLRLERQILGFSRLVEAAGLRNGIPRDIPAVYAEIFGKSIRTSKVLLGPNPGKAK